MADLFKTIRGLIFPLSSALSKSATESPKIRVELVPSTPSEVSMLTPEQSQAEKLASQAVALRDIQLPGAIDLLREAHKLWPTNRDIHFRLARYLRQANKGDEAFSIYRRMTLELDLKDYLFYGFNRAAILNEMMKQLFEENKYKEYLYYGLHELWNTLLGLAAQGRYAGIGDDIFLGYGAKTKTTKALKSLGIYDDRETISKAVYEGLLEYDRNLARLSEISKANEFPSSEKIPINGTIGSRHLAAVSQIKEYTDLFETLN